MFNQNTQVHDFTFDPTKRCVKINIVTYDEPNLRKMLSKYIQRGYHVVLTRNGAVLLCNTNHETMELWIQIFAPEHMRTEQILSIIKDEQLHTTEAHHGAIELI